MKDWAQCRILYTRDTPYLSAFQAAVAPAQVWHIPLMSQQGQALSATDLAYWNAADAMIFTSAAAVRYAPQIPPQALTVAIGPRTAEALPRCDIIAAAPYDSEALLSVWQPREHHIVIAAAVGGRSLLYQTLSVHNRVKMAYVYARYNPSQALPDAYLHADIITIASQQTLRHLRDICSEAQWSTLKSSMALAALSPRVAQYATELGFLKVFYAATAVEEALIQAIKNWWLSQEDKDGTA